MAVDTIKPGHVYDHPDHGTVVVDHITQSVEQWSTDEDEYRTLAPIVNYYPKRGNTSQQSFGLPLKQEMAAQFAKRVEPTGETMNNYSDPRDSDLRL